MAGYTIVSVAVNLQLAPSPITRQQTGALVSQGGTTLSTGTYSLLTQLSDLTPLLAAPIAITSLSWASGTVTATVPTMTAAVGTVFVVTVAGATPAGYNGTYMATVASSTTFTYALTTNPGTETVPGTYTPPGQAELYSMASTFFGQGSTASVYVLELGAGAATAGVTELNTFLTANPSFFYVYLVPRSWDGVASFLSLIANYESPEGLTYFFVTTTGATYTGYTSLMKDVVALVESPNAPASEFSLAAPFWNVVNQVPSASNKAAPFRNRFLYGVTPYPTVGNGALLATYQAASVNTIGTGAEGGISTAVWWWGTTMDGNDFSFWYSVDWVQLNSAVMLANAVINGSNNPQNPLYYDQFGINALETVETDVMNSAAAFGMVNASTASVVTATPFATYTQQNPSNYAAGIYGGLSVEYTPSRGFAKIVLNITVSQFPSG